MMQKTELAIMKRITITLPDHIFDSLKECSEILRMSESEAVEMAIKHSLLNKENFFEIYDIVVEQDK